MNNQPRQVLEEIIARYGRSILNDPNRVQGLLMDLGPGYPRENKALLSALENRVVADLMNSQGRVPPEFLLARLRKRLLDITPLSEEAALWAVESWALVLGVPVSAPASKPPVSGTPPASKPPVSRTQPASKPPVSGTPPASKPPVSRTPPAPAQKTSLQPPRPVQKKLKKRPVHRKRPPKKIPWGAVLVIALTVPVLILVARSLSPAAWEMGGDPISFLMDRNRLSSDQIREFYNSNSTLFRSDTGRTLAFPQAQSQAALLVTLQEHLGDHPQDARAYKALGDTYLTLGEYERAETSYRQALVLSPEYTAAQRNLEIAQQRRGGR